MRERVRRLPGDAGQNVRHAAHPGAGRRGLRPPTTRAYYARGRYAERTGLMSEPKDQADTPPEPLRQEPERIEAEPPPDSSWVNMQAIAGSGTPVDE